MITNQHSIEVGYETFSAITEEDHGSHTVSTLTFLVEGQVSIFHRQKLTLNKQTVGIVPAGMPHKLLKAENLELWWLSFCPSCLNLQEKDPLMVIFRRVRLGALPAVKISDTRWPFILALLGELKAAVSNGKQTPTYVAKSLLTLLLHEVNQAQSLESVNGATTSKVLMALDYINQHFLESISLKDVAKAAHSSPSHLAMLVKQETGYSVGEWLTRNKLTEACSRLIHTTASVNQIAEHVGWQDTTHFIRQFKKAFGVTPAQWRKKQSSEISSVLLTNANTAR